MKLVDAVLDTIRRQRMLKAGERVAVACSGGADSVALLLLLDELKTTLGLRLAVAHVNHQLRGPAAAADEAFVCALAGRLGVEFITARVDVAARARAGNVNLEEAGRQARLEFFAALCAAGKADVVATAHTLDDQAETVLARLLRGTGLAGLAAIQPVLEPGHRRPDGHTARLGRPSGRIVRPLIELRRADLRVFLHQRKQEWREDATNLDRARTRNRIRLELLPQLERLSPAVVHHLTHLATQARQEEQFWQVFIEERFRTLACSESRRPARAGLRGRGAQHHAGAWRIAASQLCEPLGHFYSGVGATARDTEAVQRAVAQRLVRRLVEAVRGDTRRLTGEHVEQVLRLARTGQSGQQVVLPGRPRTGRRGALRVERSFDWLVFHRGRQPEVAEISASYSYEVPVPGRVDIPAAGERLEFKLVAARDLQQGYNKGQGTALDADVLGGLETRDGQTPRLTVRNWRPGDRYQPAGAARPKKLKTLFQRARLPVAERAAYPVVVSADAIVWTPHFGVAAACALGERTRTALLIVEEPLPEKTG
ncbi:MAG: tRNA lysidine(34) synthetase TilS [Terriglobia bacterium]